MQRDLGDGRAPRLHPLEQGAVEVQACRGRRHRPCRPGEHGLVALVIGQLVCPLYVWRQRHVSVLAHETFHGRAVHARELDQADAVRQAVPDPDRDAAHLHRGPRRELLPGPDKRAPQPRARRLRVQQQDLGGSASGPPCGIAARAEQSRGQHAAVVDDQAITRPDEARQVGDRAVGPGACPPVDRQHAAVAAPGERALGDQPLGQFVVEIRGEQAPF